MLFLAERRRGRELAARLKAAMAREAEYRQQADAERQRAEQRMAEQHQAMMALIAKLSDAIDRSGYGNHKPPA